ncbi:hypothetical protein R6Q59_016558 [Mikania micrantha]
MQEVYLKGFARNVNKAAELLESIGKLESVASCFCDLGDFKRARTIFFVIIVWFSAVTRSTSLLTHINSLTCIAISSNANYFFDRIFRDLKSDELHGKHY